MLFYIIIIGVVIALDQLSKYLVVVYLKPQKSIAIIKDVFHFTYSENTGAAFSMLRDKQLLLIAITVAAMALMSAYLFKWSQSDGHLLQKICLALIIGGGIGNLIDRIRLNYVVDFIDFRLINFAIFNISDSFIVVGSICLALLVLFNVDY